MWRCFGILQCYYNLQNKNHKTHVQTSFAQFAFFLFEKSPKEVPFAHYIVLGPISFVQLIHIANKSKHGKLDLKLCPPKIPFKNIYHLFLQKHKNVD